MKDPKKFAQDKKAEKSDYATGEVGCGTGLAGKICRHNRKKLNRFVAIKAVAMRKSIDFKQTTVSVDSHDQLLAEATTNKTLLDYIQKNAADGAKIPFPTGILTLSEREPGIYHGFFQDTDGQVVEKFDSQTVALIAKNLQLKSLVPESAEATPVPVQNASDIALSAHNRIDDLQRQLIDQQRASKGIRIKYGDFELEIKKSICDFVRDFRSSQATDKDVVRKAISSWRKKQSGYINLPSDQAAAKELIENWDAHQESFCQFVDALSRGDDEQH